MRNQILTPKMFVIVVAVLAMCAVIVWMLSLPLLS
jgi:hypothetical protein